jgi:hypothetical protein
VIIILSLLSPDNLNMDGDETGVPGGHSTDVSKTERR